MIGITKQDLAEWKDSRVTRAFYAGVQAKIKQIEELMGNGTMLSSNPYETHANISRLVGHIEGLKDSLEIDETTVLGEE